MNLARMTACVFILDGREGEGGKEATALEGWVFGGDLGARSGISWRFSSADAAPSMVR